MNAVQRVAKNSLVPMVAQAINKVADVLFAKASRAVLATVEELVPTEQLNELRGVRIPYFYVTAVTEVPLGAHPTACYPFYAYDRPHTALYYEAARKGAEAFKAEYLSVFVHGAPTHADYLDRIGGEKTRTRLSGPTSGGVSGLLREHAAAPDRATERHPHAALPPGAVG